MSEKFYKVFVSSTYEDLKEERQEVFEALLKCNCFPVGMEHFPSSNLRSLDLIAKYIDQCDYFVLVSAGVYGSLVPDGDKRIGYVEWEYEYAKSRLPCFSFIVQDRDRLLGDKLEKRYVDLLDEFQQKLKNDGRNVKLYTSAADLGKSILHAFQYAPRDTPAVGWIPANSKSTSSELIGIWKLMASNVPGWDDSTVVKIFSEHEFMWLQVASTGPKGFIWGHYEHEPYIDVIREIAHATSFEGIKGKVQEYDIKIEGDVLTTEGRRSTGQYVREEFHRLDLSREVSG